MRQHCSLRSPTPGASLGLRNDDNQQVIGRISTQTSGDVFKRLFEKISGEPYLVHAHLLKDGSVLGFKINLPYIEQARQMEQKSIEAAVQHNNWFATNTKLVVFILKHINAEDILPVVENFLSEYAIAIADGQTNTLIVRDMEACVEDAITIIEKLDVPPEGE